MNDEIIKIIEPSKEDMTFLVGETKTLQYVIRSISDFKIKDLDFTLETLIKEPEGAIRKTKYEYAHITKAPKIIYPGKDQIVEISVSLPIEYKEYITKEDGNKAKQPFRIKLHATGIEHIEEI